MNTENNHMQSPPYILQQHIKEEEQAVGIMTTQYLAIRPNITVGQALQFIRENAGKVETIYSIYVIDINKHLQGVVSLKALLCAPDTSLIRDVMFTNIVSVLQDTDQEEVAKLLKQNNFIALPVVNADNHLLGIVTFDDAMRVIQKEQTEDVYKMGAMEGSPDLYTRSSILRLVYKRIPWLLILLIAGTLTTNILSHFQPLITIAGFLLWFVPVITQTGGNSGTQSSTLMIRGIATGDIHFRDIGKIFLKEVAVGLIMGLVLAAVIILRGYLLPPHIGMEQTIVICIALTFVVLFSSVAGAIAPLLIHKLGFDPTVMAGPLMATLIDVIGLTIYFQAAKLILQL